MSFWKHHSETKIVKFSCFVHEGFHKLGSYLNDLFYLNRRVGQDCLWRRSWITPRSASCSLITAAMSTTEMDRTGKWVVNICDWTRITWFSLAILRQNANEPFRVQSGFVGVFRCHASEIPLLSLFNRTALMVAAEFGNKEVCEILIRRGANSVFADNYGTMVWPFYAKKDSMARWRKREETELVLFALRLVPKKGSTWSNPLKMFVWNYRVWCVQFGKTKFLFRWNCAKEQFHCKKTWKKVNHGSSIISLFSVATAVFMFTVESNCM